MKVHELKQILSKFSDDLNIQVIVDSPYGGDSAYSYEMCSALDHAEDAAYDNTENYVTLIFAGESKMVEA